VEQQISKLKSFTAEEIREFAEIEAPDDPNYILSESLLYLLRHSEDELDNHTSMIIFKTLRARVLKATPTPARRLSGSTKLGISSRDVTIQEKVLDKFQELLCEDRGEYAEQLDFFEIRFNQAVARLRHTAHRGQMREERRFRSLEAEASSAEQSPIVQRALAALTYRVDHETMDFLFRSNVYMAISSLPPSERRVVELLLEGMLIDSKDPNEMTIAKVLGCTGRTVQNRRDRAFESIRSALRQEEEE
jgi:DNA-directed RNA polymerase specialized sigma24 family protein